MATRQSGREVISVTMKPDIYAKLKEICVQKDLPVSVFIRNLILKELDARGQ